MANIACLKTDFFVINHLYWCFFLIACLKTDFYNCYNCFFLMSIKGNMQDKVQQPGEAETRTSCRKYNDLWTSKEQRSIHLQSTIQWQWTLKNYFLLYFRHSPGFPDTNGSLMWCRKNARCSSFIVWLKWGLLNVNNT